MLSAFRIVEFNEYLRLFPECKVLTNKSSFKILNDNRGFKRISEEYYSYYPLNSGKIIEFERDYNIKAKLAYCVFLHNMLFFLNTFEKNKIPFVFTLYPGGGFFLNDEKTDKALKRIFGSPFFRKVIVTQKVTKDYLLKKKLCDRDSIKFMYGYTAPMHNYDPENRRFYPNGKNTLDICFVANKYMPGGLDKGYDTFIKVAHKLSKKYSFIRYHVVGNFDEHDMDITEIKERIVFYNALATDGLQHFFATQDIILSPNKAFVLHKGAFDGFPTGSCVEAGLNGVALFISDPLHQNEYFENNKEIVIIPAEEERTVEILENYISSPDKIYHLANYGQLKLEKLFDPDIQLLGRTKLLSELMTK